MGAKLERSKDLTRKKREKKKKKKASRGGRAGGMAREERKLYAEKRP